MNNILLIIMLLLMVLIDGKKGLKLFISLIINFIILMLIFYLIALGFNSIIITVLGSLLISYIILYFINKKDIKTDASFKSVFIVLLILSLSIYIITKLSNLGGFGFEEYEEINMFSFNVKISFDNIMISLILIGLLGATVDASISISSALYEVYRNNPKISKKELYTSGIVIGKDILGTTTNTLLFAFLAEFMTLIIWFKSGNYSILEIINNKTFNQEIIKILFSGLGCIIVIQLTALIITNMLVKKERKN